MLRFQKLSNKEMLLKHYKAFILPHFCYCSVWHFCGACNADKVDNLNKRILVYTTGSPYDILLSKVNMKSLFIRCLQNFMITLYESVLYKLSRLF